MHSAMQTEIEYDDIISHHLQLFTLHKQTLNQSLLSNSNVTLIMLANNLEIAFIKCQLIMSVFSSLTPRFP